jgi:hypothetical protein
VLLAALSVAAGALFPPARALADGAFGGTLGLSSIDDPNLDHRPVFGVFFLNTFEEKVSLRLDLIYLSGDDRFGRDFYFNRGGLGVVDTVRSDVVTTETSLSLGSGVSYDFLKSERGHLLRGAAGFGIHRRTASWRGVQVAYEEKQKDVSLQLFAALAAEWRIPARPYFLLGEVRFSTFSDFEQVGAIPLSDLEKDDLVTMSVGFGYRFTSPRLFRPRHE